VVFNFFDRGSFGGDGLRLSIGLSVWSRENRDFDYRSLIRKKQKIGSHSDDIM
jgi:hypothetical protein